MRIATRPLRFTTILHEPTEPIVLDFSESPPCSLDPRGAHQADAPGRPFIPRPARACSRGVRSLSSPASAPRASRAMKKSQRSHSRRHMRRTSARVIAGTLVLLAAPPLGAQQLILSDPPEKVVTSLVDQLDLERYKATIKGLTRFGDRRQGTARNRDAVDWIEAQLKSYGCTPTERLTYQWQPPPLRQRVTIGPNQAV